MKYKRVKLIKTGITGRIPAGFHPNGIEQGYTEEPPKVGEMFFLYPYNRISITNTPNFHTSLVTEIISDTEFRTLNSLYKIETWKN